MTNEKFIENLYKALKEKLGQHNHLVEAKSMWKWCIDCKKKAITISQPTDPVTRFADYRILCLNCNTTQIIKSNNYSKKQELDSFISNLIVHFKLEDELTENMKIEDYAFDMMTTTDIKNGIKEVFGADFKHYSIEWQKTEYAESVFNDQGILEFDGTNERSRVLTFQLKIYLKLCEGE